MYKRAVILAGGKGTRLRPYTIAIPKALVPVGEYPIAEIVIRQLAKAGFGHITIAIGHQADVIKAFFGEGARWGVKVDYSMENVPLSTMAPLRLIHDLPDNFLVMNGDVLTDIDYNDFYDFHVKNKNIFTISACRRKDMTEYGVLEIDKDGCLIGFREKPILSYDVSMGIYMVNKAIIRHIPKNRPYGFNNLMVDLLNLNKKVSVKMFNGFWLDIGRPDDYSRAIKKFSNGRNIW